MSPRQLTTRAALLACLGAVALPATAMATTRYNFEFGPIKSHGYTVEGVLTPETATKYNLGFVFDKESGSQTQTYFFGYSEPVTLTASKSLSSASVNTSLGAAGSVSIKFTATSSTKEVQFGGAAGNDLFGCKVPKWKERSGTTTGSFSLVTGTAFGTVTGHNVTGRLVKEGGTPSCKSQNIFQLQLNGPPMSGADTFGSDSLLAYHSGKSTGATATYTDGYGDGPEPNITLTGEIDQLKPSSMFSYKSNLSSARVHVSGAFMSGTTTFTSNQKCVKGYEFGSIAGTIAAHFFIGGTLTYPSGNTNAAPAPVAMDPNPFGTLSENYPDCTSGF